MEKKYKSKILLFIPIFLLIATDGIFSIQSILPLIALTFLIDILFLKLKIKKQEFYCIGVFIIISIMSLVHNSVASPDLITSQSIIRIIYYLVILLFYYSMTHVQYTGSQLRIAILSLIFVDCFISVYFIFVNKIWFKSLLGITVDKNFIGLFLMLGFVFCFCFALNENNKRKKVLFFALMILLALGIFFSASRASVLFAILSCIVCFLSYLKQIGTSRKGLIKALILVLVVPVILLVIIVLLESKMSSASINITWYWNRYFVNGYGDKSVTGRFEWWNKAFQYFFSRPLFGYGIGNVNVSGNSSAVAHNTYIDFLVDQGSIGFFLFINIIWKSIKGILKKKSYMYYGIVFAILIGIFNVSATRSTFLWFSLILLCSLSNMPVDEKVFTNKKNI